MFLSLNSDEEVETQCEQVCDNTLCVCVWRAREREREEESEGERVKCKIMASLFLKFKCVVL